MTQYFGDVVLITKPLDAPPQAWDYARESIRSVTTFSGKIFIDATYEGDLMAGAGVTIFYGQGPLPYSMYNESMAGVLFGKRPILKKINPYIITGDPSSGIIARVSSYSPGKECSGYKKVQAYCFRVFA